MPSASWGLSHVRQRLHTLYGDLASMHITQVTAGGTCMVLKLPLTTAVGTPSV
jgi:LytS/YehU family sensor histidine kinase